MTLYVLSAIAPNAVLPFDPATDVLRIDTASLNSFGLSLIAVAGGWTMRIGTKALTLSGVSFAQLQDLHIELADGSRAFIASTGSLAGTVGNDALMATLVNGVTLSGGTGSDIYFIDDANDTIVEAAGAGSDTVRSSVSHQLAANVERLIFTGSAHLVGIGNELDNALFGNAGNNELQGGAGNDWLDGSPGTDTLIGGSGNDGYVVDNVADVVLEAGGEGTDLVRSFANDYQLGSNVENLELGGSASINGAGNELDNVLKGNAGNNRLSGGAGNDVLDGGDGTDTLDGGAGNDLYLVSGPGDRLIEAAGGGLDTVRSSASYSLGDAGGQVENLVLTGLADLEGFGNELGNVLTGNGGHNALHGYGGADSLVGGAGNDSLLGYAGIDTCVGGTGDDVYTVDQSDVVVEKINGGIDSVYTWTSYTLSAQVENLYLSYGGTSGTGNELANLIVGNENFNLLAGLDGDDTLRGGLGEDELQGGTGKDDLDPGTGFATLSGGSGSDIFRLTVATGSNAIITDFESGTDRIVVGQAVTIVGTPAASLDPLDAAAAIATVDATLDQPELFAVNNGSDMALYLRRQGWEWGFNEADEWVQLPVTEMTLVAWLQGTSSVTLADFGV